VTRDELQADPTPPLVLHVGAGRVVQVNGAEVAFDELRERLKRMFAARDDHVIFFDAADDAEYGFAVETMDQARAGGAVTIATLTNALAQAAPAPAAP
jgi:biopolymer transport protein ExbD/biopolymer transport protein TolR